MYCFLFWVITRRHFLNFSVQPPTYSDQLEQSIMSSTTCNATGVLSSASSTVTTYFTEKKNLETMLQTVRFFPRRLVRWAFSPGHGACAVENTFIFFFGMFRDSRSKNCEIRNFFVALSFKFYPLKKYK